MIFDIPEVQQIAILTEWLLYKEFGRFHSALCSKVGRAKLQALLAREHCVFNYTEMQCAVWNDDRKGEEKAMQWIMKNGLKFREVDLNGPHLENEHVRKQILSYYGARLNTVKIDLTKKKKQWDYMGSQGSFGCELSFDLSAVLQELATLCPNLRHLSMSRFKELICLDPVGNCDSILNYLKANAKRLESIAFHQIDDIPRELLQVIAGLPSLQTVEFLICSFSQYATPLDTDCHHSSVHTLKFNWHVGMCALFPNVINLTVTDLYAENFSLLVQYCAQVRYVSITFNNHKGAINAKDVSAMCAQWKALETLELLKSGMTEDIMLLLIQNCSTLITLCTAYGMKGSPKSTGLKIALSTSSALQTLCVQCTEGSFLHSVVAMCPNLTTLQLEPPTLKGCRMPTSHIKNALHALNSTTCRVQSLYLNNCTGLRDEHLALLAHTKLHTLGIAGSDHITSIGILHLVVTLHKLRTFEIRWCGSVKHDVLTKIPSLCSALRDLTFRQQTSCDCLKSSCHCSKQKVRDAFVGELFCKLFPHVKKIEIAF